MENTYLEYIKNTLIERSNLSAPAIEQLNSLIKTLEALPIDQQEDQLINFFDLFIGANKNLAIGFEIGKSVPLTSFGKIGLGYRFAPTFYDAMKLITDYHQFFVTLFIYSLTLKKEEAIFEVGFTQALNDRVEAILVSAVVQSLFSEIDKFGINRDSVISISIKEGAEMMAPLYSKHLGIKPLNGKRNQVVFNLKKIRQENPLSDVKTYLRLKQEIINEINTLPNFKTSTSYVARFVKQNVDTPPSLSDIANAMGLSTRQLRFKLTKENASYQEIVRNARKEYAINLLANTNQPVSQIADKLAYKDVASFNHSFKRWTGINPSTYRKNHTSS